MKKLGIFGSIQETLKVNRNNSNTKRHITMSEGATEKKQRKKYIFISTSHKNDRLNYTIKIKTFHKRERKRSERISRISKQSREQKIAFNAH